MLLAETAKGHRVGAPHVLGKEVAGKRASHSLGNRERSHRTSSRRRYPKQRTQNMFRVLWGVRFSFLHSSLKPPSHCGVPEHTAEHRAPPGAILGQSTHRRARWPHDGVSDPAAAAVTMAVEKEGAAFLFPKTLHVDWNPVTLGKALTSYPCGVTGPFVGLPPSTFSRSTS
jgi:hypothetical protein